MAAMVSLAALPLLVVIAGAQAPTTPPWLITSGTQCNGTQVDYAKCDVPACGACVPQNCSYSQWSEWSQGPGCSGVCIRSRNILEQNNECGGPCSESLRTTKKCRSQGACTNTLGTDCQFGAWGNWAMGECQTDQSQMSRKRPISVAATAGGKQCQGSTTQTTPCVTPLQKQDCEWGQWSGFTSCSVACGPGRMTRMRRVHKEARLGGKTCNGGSLDVQGCGTTNTSGPPPKACAIQNCEMKTWSEWRGCDASNPLQKVRNRQIGTPARVGGSPCTESLKELAPCNGTVAKKLACKLTDWSEWMACDKTCDGGQKTRHKVLVNPDGLGYCATGSVRQIGPCGTGSCLVPNAENDCQLSQWSVWDTCSARCGPGVKIRKRTSSSAKNKGISCGSKFLPVGLEEVGQCTGTNCEDVNCRWSDWEAWSGCTLTCGGGTQRRHRYINQSPENKGRKCAAYSKNEITPCNTMPCGHECVDAAWGVWSTWSMCSRTCGQGFRSRTRREAQEPNECGQDVSGVKQEYVPCTGTVREHCVEPKDCAWGEWDAWSSCTATCFGIRERNRVITQFPEGIGKKCPQVSTRQIDACNPVMGEKAPSMCNTLTPKKDCVLTDWSEWSKCSRECGKGQHHRGRHILQPAMHAGKPCPMDLSHTTGCNEFDCGGKNLCVDCEMDVWGAWSACTKSGNQKRRTRNIKTQRNQCGKPCQQTTTKEIAKCDSLASGILYCKWATWTAFQACPSGCGATSTRRHRSLEISTTAPHSSEDLLYQSSAGSGTIVCTGTQKDEKPCAASPQCTPGQQPIPCNFTAWSEWSNATAAGLCTRQRQVATFNNAVGTPCQGPLVETKTCQPRLKVTLDCSLSGWGMWSQCSSPVMQRFRIRTIRQMPQEGGAACTAVALRETAPCTRQSHSPEDCAMSSWTIWGRCSRTCNAGWQLRTRRIVTPAMYGGVPCSATMEDVQACEIQACPLLQNQDCKLGKWDDWSGCHSDGQKYRERYVAQEAHHKGKACTGETHMTAACSDTAVDCQLSDWAPWMPCSMSCRGGTTVRHRQVNQWPVNGGAQCPTNMSLAEVKPCHMNVQCSNSTDCQITSWTAWSDAVCSATCGPGQLSRTRQITGNRTGSGQGCNENLVETGPCLGISQCPTTDCAWGDWSQWGTCSKTCGGGRLGRQREITVPPAHGGKACPASLKEEMRNCSTTPCPSEVCVNGEWGDWLAWEPCSKSCAGGLTWRSRHVATPASSCGKPAEGKSQEVGACNSNVTCVVSVDCVLSAWDAWSACSASCGGTKRRSRRVMVEGAGAGAFCTGALKQAAPCNPDDGQVVPAACAAAAALAGANVDCEYGEWGIWGACTRSCNGGQRIKRREVLQEHQNGGAVCNEALVVTEGCNLASCQGPCGTPCMWTAWSAWSACTQCGGQQQRTRRVVPAAGGGNACEMRAAQETKACPAHCHEHFYCAWSAWQEWSGCSAQCGEAYKSKRRDLALVTLPAGASRETLYEVGDSSEESELQERFHQLWRQSQRDEAVRGRELGAAFAGGGLVLLLVLAVVRVVVKPAGAPHGQGRGQATLLEVETDSLEIE